MLRTFTSSLPARRVPTRWLRLGGQDGATLVEFALGLILFLMMLFGICGFGHALYAYHFVSEVAREATRWAAVHGSTCAGDASCTGPATSADIQNYVTTMTPAGIDPSKLTVTASWPATTGPCVATSNAPGCPVEVQVSYNYSFIFPLISVKPVKLSSTSRLVITH